MQLTCAVRTQPSQQLKPDVPLHTHGTSVDLEDVSSPLKEREEERCSQHERGDDSSLQLCPQYMQTENTSYICCPTMASMSGLESPSAHDTKVRK